MIQDFFKGSWRPKVAGILLVAWECYHEGCAYIGSQPIGGRNVVKALLIGVALWFVRDAKKSSEDEGIKPDTVSIEAIKKVVTDVVLGAGGKLVLLFALTLTCSSCHAVNIAPIDIKPEAVDVKPNAVHIEMLPNAVSVSTTGHVDTGAVHVDGKVETDAIHTVVSPGAAVMQTGAIKATIEPNAFPSPLARADIPIEITTQPKTVNIELHIEPNAFVVHAEGITDAATKPMAEIKAAVLQAGGKAELYLWYFAIGSAVAIVALVIERIFMHYRHARQLAQKEDAT